jgi:hypothetical protein
MIRRKNPYSPPAPWLTTCLFALLMLLPSGTVALAAPALAEHPLSEQSPLQATPDPADNVPAPNVGAATRSLYLPKLRNTTNLETLETSVVKLEEVIAQSQTQTKPPASPFGTGATLLPAPPPGAELYPAQPDADRSIEPSATAMPENLNGTVTLVDEDFEGTFPQDSWRTLDSDGTHNGEYYWDDDDAMASSGKNSTWAANGGKNGLDPVQYNYPNNMQSWMIYGPFDLSDATSAHFNFHYWNISEINYDYLGWYASPNGKDFYGQRVSGNSTGWKPVSINLASVPAFGNMLDDSSVWIAFRFTSDGSDTYRGAFIDQVSVQKEMGGECSGEFKAEYFDNRNLSGTPVFTLCEKAPINHNWGTSGPGNGINNDNFSVRWTGTVEFTSDLYNFVAIADDGIRVWIDDNQIIDNWQNQSVTPNMSTRQISAGKHVVRVEYYEDIGGALTQFRWLRSETQVSDRQAFDTCFLPNTSEMQEWWNKSPYSEIGIYIGGNNRGCKAHNREHLTAGWVDSVQDQGWNLIPTWVGPQAPCTNQNFYTMSSDPGVAYEEGRQEAGDAANATKDLGLTTQDLGGTLIYYDMEPYPDNADCRQAVKSFMAGWTSRLHELGNQAGAYGAACASYITDWVQDAPYVLDHIWPASWVDSRYNASASVWDISCLDNSLWSEHQRIRQYAGDHNETWGTLTINIDSNVLDGQVAGENPRNLTAASAQESWQPLHVTDLQLLAENTGWIIADGQLLWSTDGGTSWMNRTSAELDLDVRAATFIDLTTGWLVGAGNPDAQGRSTLYLGKSMDGGLTWQVQPLSAFNPIEPSSTQGSIKLSFFDANNGYVQIKLASSSTFDIHTLLKTTDGGATWQEVNVPGNSAIHFTDASTGWTVSTVTDAQPQITIDGGASWNPTELAPTATTASANADQIATALGATATSFLNNGTGWVFVKQGLCSGVKSSGTESSIESSQEPFDCIQYSALLSTPDGGNTWLDITPSQD